VGQKLKVSGARNNEEKIVLHPNGGHAFICGTSVIRPPVGQRCWQWPASGKVILPYSTRTAAIRALISRNARYTDLCGRAGKVVYVVSCGLR
jgi:lipoprotein YgeR